MKNSALKTTAVKHPYLFSIVVVLIFEISMMLVTVFMKYFAPSFLLENGDFVIQGTVEAFLCLVAIGTVALFGYNSIWNESGTGFIRGLDVGAYFLVISIVSLLSTASVALMNGAQLEKGWKIAVFVICVFLIGLCEEAFFRGVIANLFFDRYEKSPAGIWSATVASGMVFGLMHLMNLINFIGQTGVRNSVVGVIVQVFSACTMGMALSAIYFRCRNIWVLIFIHGFVDFCGAFTAGVFTGGSLMGTIGSYSPEMCISALWYVVLTIFLLRKKKMRTILAYEHEKLGLPAYEGNLTSSAEAKKSRIKIILISIVIAALLFGTACALYEGEWSFFSISYEFSAEKNIPGGEIVVEQMGELTASSTRSYTLTILSYPSNNNASATVSIVEASASSEPIDAEDAVFSATYDGRQSDVKSIYLESGKTYIVTVEYDYLAVTSESASHSMSITIQ